MQQNSDKLLSRLKNKLKKQQFTALPDYPNERCIEPPDRVELQLSMKFLRRRRINMKKKYRAVLENGSLELHHPKQTELNGFTIEYRVDLAKVLLLYDEQRVVVKLQTEVLLLYPATMALDRFRDMMHQHRLWSQEKMAEKTGGPPRSFAEARSPSTQPNCSSLGTLSGMSGMESFPFTDSTDVSTNPMQEFLKQTHAMSLNVLDVSSRHLETMRLIVDEVKGLVDQLKKTKTVVAPPAVPVTPIVTAIPSTPVTPVAVVPSSAPIKEKEAKTDGEDDEEEDED